MRREEEEWQANHIQSTSKTGRCFIIISSYNRNLLLYCLKQSSCSSGGGGGGGGIKWFCILFSWLCKMLLVSWLFEKFQSKSPRKLIIYSTRCDVIWYDRIWIWEYDAKESYWVRVWIKVLVTYSPGFFGLPKLSEFDEDGGSVGCDVEAQVEKWSEVSSIQDMHSSYCIYYDCSFYYKKKSKPGMNGCM